MSFFVEYSLKFYFLLVIFGVSKNLYFAYILQKEKTFMSFYTTNRPGVFPGAITNCNATGVCERVCINTKKVFDSCLSQSRIPAYVISLTNLSIDSPTYPLTFVSGVSDNLSSTTVSDIDVTRFVEQPNFARIQATVSIPMIISFTDADGISGTGTGNIIVNEDVVLYVPQPSVIPFSIEAIGNCVCSSGTYVSENNFSIDVCLSIVLKIVADVCILVPSYGYCPIPPCTPYDSSSCDQFFDMPLYPTAVSPPQ